MSDELETRVDILTALFNSGDADAGAQFYALIKTWERKDVEIAFCRVTRILAATARTPAAAAAELRPSAANVSLGAAGKTKCSGIKTTASAMNSLTGRCLVRKMRRPDLSIS